MGLWSTRFPVLSLALLLFLSAVTLRLASADWLSECPRSCSCKWISGKKAALCVDVLLDSVPRMGSDVQHLDLSNNTIQVIFDYMLEHLCSSFMNVVFEVTSK
jgi:hypothetical protein